MTQKKIKVGIFVEGRLLPSYDGASNRFHYLSKFLQLSGKVDIVIFHCHRGYTDIELVKDEPFTTYLISEENYYHNLELLAAIIQEEQIDILQFNDLEPILYQGVRLSNMTDTRLVYEIHYDSARLAKTLGEKDEMIDSLIEAQGKIGKNIDHAICLSSDDKDNLLPVLGIKEHECEVIPSGVDLNENNYHVPNLKNKKIVFLGNLYFKPNEDAVRALKDKVYPKLIDSGFSFLIAGDCPEQLKEELSAQNFDCVGAVKDLNSLFSEVSICAAPILEGSGMRIKFLNFMSGGIPILTTQIATNGFEDKNNFIIENDIDRYAEIIINLFQGDKLAVISKNNRKIMERHYSWQKIADRVIRVYEKVINTEIKPKTDGVEMLGKPAWLNEVVGKGRYKAIKEISQGFSFAKVSNGTVEDFALKDIIAIEGMPGAGKTTFVDNFQADKAKTVKELFLKIPDGVQSDFEIQKLYLLSEKDKFKHVSGFFKEYEKIILDRSAISTLAYSYADGKVKNDMAEYEKTLEVFKSVRYEIISPTHLVVLDCSIEESIRRRGAFQNVVEYKKWFNPEFLTSFRDFYGDELSKITSTKTTFIDTSGKTITEVDRLIKEIL